VLLVPDLDGRHRGQLRSALQADGRVVGLPGHGCWPGRRTAARAGRELNVADEVVDTDEHLVELVLTADARPPTICAGTPGATWPNCDPTPPTDWPRRCGHGFCTRVSGRRRR